MEERYNVYFAGQVMVGNDPGIVRDRLGKLFNADAATLDQLFSGKPQVLKRDCDVATAQKYQAALERAGAVPIVKLTEASLAPPKATPPRAMTAAEKIAALAAAPDENRYQKPLPASHHGFQRDESEGAANGILLAPPGTEVLREDERTAPVLREVDTSGLTIDSSAERLSVESPAPPPAPDTSHLSMGKVGDAIPNLASPAAPLSPNLDGLALSAPGTDFSDCAAPEMQGLVLDLSALEMLPPGKIPLAEQQRQRLPTAAPSTDHIRLEE